MNTLVIDETRKSLSVECCLETKMRLDVQLLYDVMADTIGYIQIKVRAASSEGGGGDGRWGEGETRSSGTEKRCSHNLQSGHPACWSADKYSIFPTVNIF